MEFSAPAYLFVSSLVCGLGLCGSAHARLRTMGLLMLLPPALWGVVAMGQP